MTDKAQPEHCGHEHPCKAYNENFYQDRGSPCICKKCMDDTRSRPHTTAPEKCSFCDTHENNLMACYATEHKMTCAFVKQENKCPINKVARAATFAENTRVLDTMEDWLKNDKCPPKKKKGAKCDIGCGRCMINALRQQQEREGK